MSRPCIGDWVKLSCGDEVCRHDDPRHVGRLESIENSAVARVTWSNGWIEYMPIREIRRSDDELARRRMR